MGGPAGDTVDRTAGDTVDRAVGGAVGDSVGTSAEPGGGLAPDGQAGGGHDKAGRRSAGRPTSAELGHRRLTALQRRQQLFDVALRLFAEHGYRATTMDDIAEAAGVTKPLVYQHFSSKRALYLELVDSIARDLTGELAEATSRARGPRQQVELGFRAFFEQVARRENAFRLLFGRSADDDVELGEALRRVEDAIAEAIDPLIAAGLDPEHRRLLAYAVVGMAEGAMRWWIDRSPGGPGGHGAAGPGGPGTAAGQERCLDAGALDEARRLADRLADLAWAGLRSVHAD